MSDTLDLAQSSAINEALKLIAAIKRNDVDRMLGTLDIVRHWTKRVASELAAQPVADTTEEARLDR